MGVWEKLDDKGIALRRQTIGEHQTTCPECSESRKPMNRKKPCLSVRVEADRAVWCCHHCNYRGVIFADDRTPLRKESKPVKVAKKETRKRWW